MYSLSKSRSILRNTYKNFKRHKNSLDHDIQEKIRRDMIELQEAITNRDKANADRYARILETAAKKHLKRSFFFFVFDGVAALTIALIVAVIVRQTAFEIYEIPSGSMRPTFKEQDKLVVSKTQFGINIPLRVSHLLFDPSSVKRMGVVVFTGENMDISNVETKYFYLFPGYKQYIKRMIGLPGDTLYFYGGKIYGIDKDGNDITNELQNEEVSSLEHIPFIYMEGKAITTKPMQNNLYTQVVLEQMHMPLAKLYLSSNKEVHYDMMVKPPIGSENVSYDLYKLWGMGNFASIRIVSKETLEKKYGIPSLAGKPDYFLEISHHPSVKKAALKRDPFFRMRPVASTETSYIPLDDAHMRKIWDHIYTGRFIVKEGHFYRYGLSEKEAQTSKYLPKVDKSVPDGTYEFTEGSLYQVKLQGALEKLPPTHPLATYNPQKCFTFFNAGIECDIRFLPHDETWSLHPARYGYFRDGALYIMGAPILEKEDPLLVEFVKKEESRKEKDLTYVPFIDQGPPLKKDGSLDTTFIKTYGIHIPDKQYLVLGDNHAMSGDSRDFGFVPEDNLRGTPSFMFWAPGGRFGFPCLGFYNLFTSPRIIIWTGLLIGLSAYSYYTRRRISF